MLTNTLPMYASIIGMICWFIGLYAFPTNYDESPKLQTFMYVLAWLFLTPVVIGAFYTWATL